MSEDRIKRAERRKLKRLKESKRREICEDHYLPSMWYDDDGYIKYSGRSSMQHWLKRYNNRRLRRSTKDLYQKSIYKKVNEYWWILV